jgi:DnaD/phage-associated family protein
MAKEAYYFSHDSNARHDPKITFMRSVYGAEGYGWFWILVEMMREADGYRLDMQSKYAWNAYAQQMGCSCIEDAKKFIMDCIEEFGLFESDGKYFWSNSLLKRMQKRQEVAEKRRKAAEARWGKTQENQGVSGSDDSNEMQMDSTSNANAMQTRCSKGKESKYKSKGKEIGKYNAFSFYQNNFGQISPFIAEEMGSWIDDMSEEVVIEAMKIALSRNVRKWSYVTGILRDWFDKNAKTLDDVLALQKEFENSKKQEPVSQKSEPETGNRLYQEFDRDFLDKLAF